LENTRTSRTRRARMTCDRGSVRTFPFREREDASPSARRLCRYQRLTRCNRTIAAPASSENHSTCSCPRGMTMTAASSGPSAVPKLPPTWNSDWAKPCLPPEARRASRDASGWNTAEPNPRSEEHTSELQSRENLVCRLLLEKKKKKKKQENHTHTQR